MQVIAKLRLCRIEFLRRIRQQWTQEWQNNSQWNYLQTLHWIFIATAHLPRWELPAGVVLDGSWERALSEVVYPFSFNNVVEERFDFYWPPKKSRHKFLKSHRVGTEQCPKKLLVMEQAIKKSLVLKLKRNKFSSTSSNVTCSDLQKGHFLEKTLKTLSISWVCH